MRHREPNGLTMIELLVVIAIIGILVGILLPAVQSARESARFTQCRNHLKQISLGVHLHESQYRHFPDGGLDWFSPRSMTNGVPNISPNQNWGWMYQILPFIEESVVYAETSDDVVQQQPITLYFCPSRRSAVKVFHMGGQRALNDYAANGGIQTNSNAYWGNGTTGGFMARSRHSSLVKPASILDGLSNTLMIGEKSVNYQFYQVASCASNEGWTSGWDWDIVRWGNETPVHDNQAEPCQSWFGSVHQGGCLFALGDGSIHTVTYSIDKELFQTLSNCTDRKPLSYGP